MFCYLFWAELGFICYPNLGHRKEPKFGTRLSFQACAKLGASLTYPRSNFTLRIGSSLARIWPFCLFLPGERERKFRDRLY